MDTLSCTICLKVLHDPVQCQNNEHHFCRKCIKKHLKNSETCPMCMDQLTLETLRPVPRVILEIISQLKKPRCSHVSRGCREDVRPEDLLLHEQTCGYAPVVCSNEGCKQTVNRRDKESHETKECKLRKITCEDCNEEMMYVDYEKHQCTLRKEMNEMKARLDEITKSLKQVVLAQGEILEKLTAHDQSIKDLQNPLRLASSTTIKREETLVLNGQIFIFGDDSVESRKSFEVFNWATKTWTLIKNGLFFQRCWSFSFVFEKKILICGGYHTERIEYLNPSNSTYTSTVSSVLLPNGQYNGLLYKDQILSFRNGVVKTLLESGESKKVLEEKQSRNYSAGVHCFGNNVYIVGGQESKMEKYDVVKNEMKTLSPLPYNVSYMATVAYKDNVIILGGQAGLHDHLRDVWIYNIHSLDYKRLPSMLEKRSKCAAVIMGDVIVVMGGESKNAERKTIYLNTVEYHVIGEDKWQKLPPMNVVRYKATACVYD